MKGIAIYTPKDKEAAEYAALLAQQFSVPVAASSASALRKINAAEYILAVGTLKREQLSIHQWLKKQEKLLEGKKLILFVIDGTNTGEPEHTDQAVAASIPSELWQDCEVYYLPGDARDKEIVLNHELITKIAADIYSSAKP